MLLKYFKKDYREASLRSFSALVFVSIILGISMNKILIAFGIRNAEPLVSLQIQYSSNIPVWPAFMCGQGFTGAVAQTLKRGAPGTFTDIATNLTDNYIQRLNTDYLTTGDWTNQSGSWPCYIFNPGKNMSFKPGELDQIIILGLVNQTIVGSNPSGLLFGVFDDERNLTSVDPFVAPAPSVNTYTFTRNEKLDVNKKLHSYFFVNKQNTIPMDFENRFLAAKFAYSPDTYLVQKYTEKIPYTPYDLISSVGGLTTYALAIWFILFGRGKYRSWGLVQRYVLRNSPNARKKDNSNTLLPTINEKAHGSDNNSTLVGSKNFDDEERPSSAFYFSTSGTPTQTRFTNSISPNSVITSSYHSTKELNKRIDAKINQKLWFVEQTLNRHYLSGFKLRRYDVDLKKLGFDTSYDDDDEKALLTPPTIHHNWNNLDSNVQNTHKSIQIPSSLTSGIYKSNKSNYNSKDSLNPEEQRTQYPNVAIGQVPLEKKQRGRNSGAGSGNYQQFVNATTGGVTSSQSDNVNNNSTLSSQIQIPPSLQSGNVSNQPSIQIPPSLQSGNINNQSSTQIPPSLQSGIISNQSSTQIPPSLQSGVVSNQLQKQIPPSLQSGVISNQEQVQGAPQGPPSQGPPSQGPPSQGPPQGPTNLSQNPEGRW